MATPNILQALMRRRAQQKALRLLPHVPAGTRTILDLGAAEGYVGEALERRTGASVTLADVVPLNRTALPFVTVGEGPLPFRDRAFDVTVLAYVLHHARDAEGVMGEARRVTRGRILVLESVVETAGDRWIFEKLDRFANGLRSGGVMDRFLDPRSLEDWIAVFATQNNITIAERFGQWPHCQAMFVLDPAEGRR